MTINRVDCDLCGRTIESGTHYVGKEISCGRISLRASGKWKSIVDICDDCLDKVLKTFRKENQNENQV